MIVLIPKRNRQGRIILDLSFLIYWSEGKRGANPVQAILNETTEQLAPDDTVNEIENVFHCIIHFIDSSAEGEI